MTVSTTRTVIMATKISITMMVLIAIMVTITMISLPLLDKLAKVWFFQKTFGWLTLAWFFTFSHADIQSTKSLSRELIRLQTTKRIKLFNPKKLAAMALGANDEACGTHGIHLRLGLGDHKCLRYNPRRVLRLYQCLFLVFTVVLSKHSGINNYPIGLVDSSHPITFQVAHRHSEIVYRQG